jgi:iron complex outermembrane receptor protein
MNNEMNRLFLVIIAVFIFIADVSAVQDKAFVISGKVTDQSGDPVAGASVRIDNTFLGVYSRPDGTYSIGNLKDGTYVLLFSFMGYEQESREVVLSENVVIDVTLSRKTMFPGEVVVNATRAGNFTPLSYYTVGKEVIQKHNIGHDLPFILSMTPSLIETSEAGNGIGYTNLRIRGSDASRINVTIDGVPLNDPESQQVFWVDIPDLASSVDNIQVQRGVGTSSNGAGAFGATVSIQTKNPENKPFAEISLGAGSFNTFKNTLSVGTGLLAGKFAFQVRFSDLRSEGFIDRTGSDHRSAFMSGHFRTGKSHLKANIILGEEHTGIGWWGLPKELLHENRRYNPAGEYTDENGIKKYYDNESDNYNQNHYHLFYTRKINNNLSFNTTFHYTAGKGYYEEYKEDVTLANYGLSAATGEVQHFKSDLVRQKWMANDYYGLIYSFKYLGSKIDVTTGGGANYYSGDHYGKIIWTSVGTIDKDLRWYFNNGTKKEFNIYGKTDYSINDIISVFGDLQYRFISYDMTGNDDDLKDLGQKHRFHFFNPKAGIFLSLNSNQDAYLSFSLANREPTRSDFKEAAGDVNATPRSERLYDTELGYKMRGEKFSLCVNGYYMLYDDQLVPTGELSNTGYSIMTNVKKSYRLGIEISAGIKPFKFLAWDFNLTKSRNKILDFIEYYIDYNTSDWSEEYKSKYLGAVDIAYSPSLVGSSDMNFTIFKNTEFHFITKYVGKQYFDNTMNNDRMIDPYLVNSLRLDFRPVIPLIKSTEIQLLVNNLFNAKYESNAYGGNWYEDGDEKTWAYYFPQAGVNFLVRAGFAF